MILEFQPPAIVAVLAVSRGVAGGDQAAMSSALWSCAENPWPRRRTNRAVRAPSLGIGTPVQYEIGTGRDGKPMARNVRVI